MNRFETVAVPFVTVGNRRGLTDEQLMDNPHLMAFFEAFRHCFERCETAFVWLFIEAK